MLYKKDILSNLTYIKTKTNWCMETMIKRNHNKRQNSIVPKKNVYFIRGICSSSFFSFLEVFYINKPEQRAVQTKTKKNKTRKQTQKQNTLS
jgi:hypothetical protein